MVSPGKATFTGAARFGEATFTGDAVFDEATFKFVGHSTMSNARVGLRDNRRDVWPSGWRIAPDPIDGWSRLIYETPGTPA